MFTLQMSLMKENMKMLQDRLLKEMVNQLSKFEFLKCNNHAFVSFCLFLSLKQGLTK
jgi:hypothetical protein